MRLEVLRTCRGFCPHFFDEQGLWATAGSALMVSADLGKTWQRRARLLGGWRRAAVRIRLLDRLIGLSAFSVVRTGDGSVIAVTGAALHRLPPGARQPVPPPSRAA